ncbi:unnamed protein product [Eruca vesicaria subsp. sativa]|uniref:S-locus glycoprotein domain-containing protein n=1 Tax=Eruca vesicaria subsp. sativa TaxID=29727 RepID=A0ABC8J3J4_ERUVS|nr:unnamed protein product [Eruca vesicaria subsp. sativa]
MTLYVDVSQSKMFLAYTLLPDIKLGYNLKTGINRFLTSWKSSDDPSSGDYSYKLEHRRLPEFYLLQGDVREHRSSPWNGIQFNGIPEDQRLSYMVYNFIENIEEVAYTFQMTNNSFYSRLRRSSTGYFQRLTWAPSSVQWALRIALSGCKRRTQLSCRGDGFTRVKNMKFQKLLWLSSTGILM